MDDDAGAGRRGEIEDAARAVLAARGDAGASMLAVARRAGASNETLYRCYGGKAGLFRAVIAANAAEVRALLERDLDAAPAPLDTPARPGPPLLTLLLGESAAALNRAAAADPTGALAAALSQAGREAVLPLIAATMERAAAAGVLAPGEPREDAALYVDLVVGDSQIRRVLGALPEPSPDEVAARAERALALFLRLRGPAA